MAERNQAVLDMIGQLHARLNDLEQDVRGFDGDLTDLVAKLDRIDDRVYLLETDIEKRAQGPTDGLASDTNKLESADEAQADAVSDDGDSSENGLNILTPEAKEKIGEVAGDMREIGREAAETFSSLNEALGDITAPFKTFTKGGRRR